MVLERRTYQLKLDEDALSLEIPSRNFYLFNYFFLLQVLVFLGASILVLVAMIYEPSIRKDWWLGIPLLALFLYATYWAVYTFVWVETGKEVVKLDKRTGQFSYCKKGLREFDRLMVSLSELSEFAWCPENDEIVDFVDRFGYKGGRICFWIHEKRHRMGIALTKSEARYCLVVLNKFLKNESKNSPVSPGGR